MSNKQNDIVEEAKYEAEQKIRHDERNALRRFMKGKQITKEKIREWLNKREEPMKPTHHQTEGWRKDLKNLWIDLDVIKYPTDALGTIEIFITELLSKAIAQREREWFEQATVIFNMTHCKNCQKKAKKLLSHLQQKEGKV